METSNNEKYTIDVTTPGMDTMYVDTDAPNVISVVDYIDTDDSGYNIDWNNITITGDEPSDLTVSGDIIQETPDGSINITEIIHEQKLQIQVLTDMIQELVDIGVKVHCVMIERGWKEIDTVEDYKKALIDFK